jgi:hypothetical protein
MKFTLQDARILMQKYQKTLKLLPEKYQSEIQNINLKSSF